MDDSPPTLPKERFKINSKYLMLVLLAISIVLVISGYFIGRYSSKINQTTQDEQTEKVEQTTPSSSVSPAPKITKSPIPKTSTSEEIIVSAYIDEDCKITITSSEKDYEVSTGLAGGMNFKCTPSAIGNISPSGKFLAYEDVDGGIDSDMALFTLDYGKRVTLGVWGTSTIMDYIFLPDDKFVAINGYPDIFNEQWLSLFDLPSIFSDFSNNFNDEYYYLMPSNPTYKSTVRLPNVGRTHRKLSFSDNMIQTKSENERLLVQYELNELAMNSSNFTITPETALILVYYADEKNADPVNSPITKQILNSENSTNDYWAVDVINTKTETVLRSYLVDQKIGEVTLDNKY